MAYIDVDELGPVDDLVVAFPAERANFSGEMVSELSDLIDSNTIRVLDLVIVTKGEDGSVEATELRDADESEVGQLRDLERDLAVLLATTDVEEIGASLAPGSAGGRVDLQAIHVPLPISDHLLATRHSSFAYYLGNHCSRCRVDTAASTLTSEQRIR